MAFPTVLGFADRKKKRDIECEEKRTTVNKRVLWAEPGGNPGEAWDWVSKRRAKRLESLGAFCSSNLEKGRIGSLSSFSLLGCFSPYQVAFSTRSSTKIIFLPFALEGS